MSAFVLESIAIHCIVDISLLNSTTKMLYCAGAEYDFEDTSTSKLRSLTGASIYLARSLESAEGTASLIRFILDAT